MLTPEDVLSPQQRQAEDRAAAATKAAAKAAAKAAKAAALKSRVASWSSMLPRVGSFSLLTTATTAGATISAASRHAAMLPVGGRVGAEVSGI